MEKLMRYCGQVGNEGMMNLPQNVDALAAVFKGLPEARKKEIVDHLQAATPQGRSDAVKQMLEQDNEEGRFVRFILGKDAPGKRDAPANKKLSAPEEK